ncbi:hypothetical protein RRG08_047536 [Elysia crispata]|uniref:Uncharacterized protein n=1 Tax=Elysia crispata TaxID=231223 RepID=A0AAE1D1U9_9GAST|nr:hypothetical protein RRG08_047536 [Elysia crispata]
MMGRIRVISWRKHYDNDNGDHKDDGVDNDIEFLYKVLGWMCQESKIDVHEHSPQALGHGRSRALAERFNGV